MDVIFLPSKTDTQADVVEKLADAEIAAGVLGKADDTGIKWILAPLNESAQPFKQLANERGYSFAGTVAYLSQSGNIVAAAEGDNSDCTLILAAAIPAFAKHVTAKLKEEKDAGWTRFMQSLWS